MNPFTHLDPAPLQQGVAALKKRFPSAAPDWGLILGSGWGAAVQGLRILDEMSADKLPGLGRASVAGHSGRILLAESSGVPLLVFQGRRHWYEGEGWLPVLLPVFLLHALGARRLLLTNAAGGIRRDLDPGDLVLLRDHLNLMSDHPFRGPHQPLWGPRFPDLSEVYAPSLRERAVRAAAGAGIPLKEGVYAAVSGPAYETPAEVRMLAGLGADLVGMSTVPEAMAARSLGLSVLAVSCVTNRAAGLSDIALRHEDVLERVALSKTRLATLFRHLWTDPNPAPP